MENTFEFCPIHDALRAQYCMLVEGEIVTQSRPCPHKESCSTQLEDVAAVYATVQNASGGQRSGI